MKTVKIGVTGVGHLGRLHTQQLKNVPEAKLIGVYDSNPARAAEIAREFDTTAFESLETLLDNVDALSIVTPTVTHYDVAKAALEKSKHIFVEKPFMETIEQADRIIDLRDKVGCKIQVGHIERFNPAIMSLQPLKINPLFIEAHRMSNFNPRGTDVAVVMDLMIHDIDLILSFVKSKVKSVAASGASVISETEDIANCRILFENGCVANVTASRISAKKMRKMRFFQPDAYISVDFLEGITEVYHIEKDDFSPQSTQLAFSLGQIQKGDVQRTIKYSRLEKTEVNPLQYELQQFCRAILNDTTPPVTAEEGRRALHVAKLILDSIDEHTELVRKNWQMR
jgi:predicted dehydrogenase